MYKAFLVLFVFCAPDTNAQHNIFYAYDNNNRLIEARYENGITIKYFYDPVGNRLKNLNRDATLCPQGSTFFETSNSLPGNVYQWQIDTGTGFTNLVANAIYLGVNTELLSLNQPPTTLYGAQYRCVITNGSSAIFSGPFMLRFAVTWTGRESSAWEDPANWNCKRVPDISTDVIIDSGVERFPVVSSQAFCRTLTVNSTTQVKIMSGSNLTVAK